MESTKYVGLKIQHWSCVLLWMLNNIFLCSFITTSTTSLKNEIKPWAVIDCWGNIFVLWWVLRPRCVKLLFPHHSDVFNPYIACLIHFQVEVLKTVNEEKTKECELYNSRFQEAVKVFMNISTLIRVCRKRTSIYYVHTGGMVPLFPCVRFPIFSSSFLPPPPKVDGGYVFTPFCLCLFGCLWTGYLKKLWTDSDEIWWAVWVCDKDALIRFWWRSRSVSGDLKF